MKKLIFAMLFAVAAFCYAEGSVPHRINVPDIDGYVTLKGDFHIHTVFSDGRVWPDTRVDEAYMDGLDFIAITDHLDTRHMKKVKSGLFNCDRDESYRIAAKAAKRYGIMVIHGGELSRGMAPGHFNTLFDKDCDQIAIEAEKFDDDNAKAAEAGLAEAQRQGAFTYWNHPHWERDAPNETKWYPEHTKLYKAGLMQGIEIVNHFCGFSSEAYGWALDKNLALLSGTDAHDPMFLLINYELGQRRPITLVFAKERTQESIKEALLACRTAVFADGKVYGRKEQMVPLLSKIIEVSDIKYGEKKITFRLTNNSSIPVHLLKAAGSENYTYLRDFTLNPSEEMTMSVTNTAYKTALAAGHITINFTAENFWIGVEQGAPFSIEFDVPQR